MRIKYILHFLFVPIFVALLVSQVAAQRIPITPEEMAISVKAGQSRGIAYTNKEAGVYFTETNAEQNSSWQGWRVMSKEIMDDYRIKVGNSFLERKSASAKVYPHQLVRSYSNGITETVTVLDTLNAIVVELQHLSGKKLSVSPAFTDIHSVDQCEVSFEHNTLLVAHKNHMAQTEKDNYPVWIGVIAESPTVSQTPDQQGNAFFPASLETEINDQKSTIVFVAGDTKENTILLAQNVLKRYGKYIDDRHDRMERLLNRSYIRTADSDFDLSLYWAKISLDALIMNQGKKGIFAGLPWFDDYWGRDTYISLPGATLVTGDFEDAKEILTSFSQWQDTNSSSSNYGRIPNIVTTSSIAYNTADGTPRFVMALYDYFKYSLDVRFLYSQYPTVKRSIDGTIMYHTDSLGFLTHGDAETWMDAVGGEGPWSARGNRANDIQLLWYKQLSIGFRLAEFIGDRQSQNKWGALMSKLQRNFVKYFYDPKTGAIYDHLNKNGTPDKQLRPNLLFTYPMFPYQYQFIPSFKNVTHNLVLPYGVASLSPDDKNFHPYHHFEPNYVQDAAYHNGIVWTWLAGPWIDVATMYGWEDTAFVVTKAMSDQILTRGAVGTLSELLDAYPRPNESQPRLSGAYSQAWSLAEFVRTCYQSYLGAYINTNAFKTTDNIAHATTSPRLLLNPRLPLALSKADFTVSIQHTQIDISYLRTSTQFVVTIYPQSYIPNLTVDIVEPPEFVRGGSADSISLPVYRLSVPVNKKSTFALVGDLATLEEEITKGDTLEYDTLEYNSMLPVVTPSAFSGLMLAAPQLQGEVPALKGPDYPVLTNSIIKQSNPNAAILYDATDPAGDDTGTTGYSYPRTTNIEPKSFDLTKFTVSSDTSNVYFSLKFANLSNPGWHPEYGFQLTYVAIAIDKDGKPNSGNRNVGMNSNYTLDSSLAFEDIIYVGGGIRLVNSDGKTVTEYLPVPGDEKHPLGSTTSKSIEFALPQKYLGVPLPQWRFVVLVGCQDDHGGAGVGEFRTVEAQAGEWTGGGKKNPSDPNVYDVMVVGK